MHLLVEILAGFGGIVAVVVVVVGCMVLFVDTLPPGSVP
jgi:hypothetical protein